jgi:hypothetical protein
MLANSTPDNSEKIDPVVLASFQKSFTSAQDVSWSDAGNFYRAQFLLNCQYVSAFFTKEGSMLGLTKNISFTQLPIFLQANLKEVQENTWITDLFELSNEDGTTYYLTLENANEKITYRSVKNEWTLYQKKSK